MLNKFVAVYVPGTQGLSGKLSATEQSNYARETARKLAGKFGGATTAPAVGYYVADNGELVEESVIIVKSFYDEVTDAVNFALDVAGWLKAELHQELVSVETVNGLQFV